VAIPSALDPSVRTLKLSKTERMAFDCLRMIISSGSENQTTKDKWKADFFANSTSGTDKAKERAFYRCVTKLGQVKAIVTDGDIVRLNEDDNLD
jgi:hypothetical protein